MIAEMLPPLDLVQRMFKKNNYTLSYPTAI